MTVEMMRSFGVTCHHGHDWKRFEVPGSQAYLGTSYQVEPDASAASYFLAAAAICGGTATVSGLNENSLQGDVKFVRVLEQMGCQVKSDLDSISVTGPALVGIDVDMVDISDTAQTVAVVAAFVRGSTQIRNIAHNRIKETDRIGCLANELRRLGVRVEEFSDGLQIHPDRLRGAELETYDDHRMAMSLALVGLRVPEVSIKNPGCVAKTYPNYFEDLKRFCETNRV
jgi:3-phosphoshikimate 1-carboxyvinyltransferase